MKKKRKRPQAGKAQKKVKRKPAGRAAMKAGRAKRHARAVSGRPRAARKLKAARKPGKPGRPAGLRPRAKPPQPKPRQKKMKVEFKTRVPDGKEKTVRHEVERLEDVQVLETNIDRLYVLVRREGQLKVRDVAKRFGVDASLVEEWGRILEEHGLAELHYPAFGELTVRSKEWEEERKTEKEKKKAEKKEERAKAGKR